MKLKFLFFFLALLLTAVWTILLVLTLKERGALFYIGEGVITFSLVFLVYFYRKVVKPLDIIGNGMELLREQDFSSRLTPVGQKEADRIVLVFNRMMEQLKDERLRLREQNHFLDLLVSASPMGVVILTLDGHISMLNAAALRFLDHFFVCLFLCFHHLGSQTFHQNKRMRKASVNKRKPGTAVNHGVTQTNCFRSIFGNTFYFFGQRGSQLAQQSASDFL